jgi:glutamate synthase domain-containing protein 3
MSALKFCNQEMVSLTRKDPVEVNRQRRSSSASTPSRRAAEIVLAWDQFASAILRVMPNDYQRVLEAREQLGETGMDENQVALAVFEINNREPDAPAKEIAAGAT